jgi:pyruvate, orthophosphate dikinase
MAKWVYTFGDGRAEGRAGDKELLGGKGANLAEMCSLGLPVPPGFTITTEVCTHYYANARTYPADLAPAVDAALEEIGRVAGRRFGDAGNLLLVSVRSGGRASMPGMMDTVLNLGLNDETVEALAARSGDARFAYDSYRRFIQMYSDVVMGLDHEVFEEILEDEKARLGRELDTEVTADEWRAIVALYKARVQEELERPFPQDPREQLWGAIGAVFSSWMNHRAVTYRRLHDIPESWGTAVNVQAMVFGNMGDSSATGVAFTRNPSTGERKLYGEFLINAQGEDVVAGIRTPQNITEEARIAAGSDRPSLQKLLPRAFQEFVAISDRLEKHYRDMQDLEFTIEQGRLWMLQTRSGKRTAKAALKIAVDMANEGLITRQEAIGRIEAGSLDQLLHPTIDPKAERKVIASGLPASPGAATGEIVFSSDEAEDMRAQGRKAILVRVETSPEDIHGMHAAEGILTTRGGMTSHAAVVARGMGKPCVSGAGGLRVDYRAGTLMAMGVTLKKGDVITIDGSTGQVLQGAVAMLQPELSGDFAAIMEWADAIRRMRVRTNAETPADARTARSFGAEGIGLCRTEHMFFDGERIVAMREMILADTEAGRRTALAKLLPMQRSDFVELFEIMAGLPVTIRLLDPPLHEFLPKTEDEIAEVAGAMGLEPDARPSRLPAGRLLSRDRRDAGARDLRGGGGGGPADGRSRRAGGDGAAGGARGRAGLRQAEDRPGGGRGDGGDRHQGGLSRGHDDRTAARGPARPCDRQIGRILLLRHQRPDADDLRHQPRRRLLLPGDLPDEGHHRAGPVRDAGRGRGGGTGADRRRKGPRDAPRHQARHLRRAWRRPRLDPLLRGGGAGLRLVLALPRAHRKARRRPGGREGVGSLPLEGRVDAQRPGWGWSQGGSAAA